MPSQRALAMASLIIHKMLVKYEFVVRFSSKMFLINIYVCLELNYDCYLHLNERPNNYYFTFNVVVRPQKTFSVSLFFTIRIIHLPHCDPQPDFVPQSHSNSVFLCACCLHFRFPDGHPALPLSRKEWVRQKVTEREGEEDWIAAITCWDEMSIANGRGRDSTQQNRTQIRQSSL